jgi:hypothetical protein
MAVHVLGDANQADPTNVKTQIWRPSRPVIQLAASIAVVIDIAEKCE